MYLRDLVLSQRTDFEHLLSRGLIRHCPNIGGRTTSMSAPFLLSCDAINAATTLCNQVIPARIT
jgi:hypothetical protein